MKIFFPDSLSDRNSYDPRGMLDSLSILKWSKFGKKFRKPILIIGKILVGTNLGKVDSTFKSVGKSLKSSEFLPIIIIDLIIDKANIGPHSMTFIY